MRTSSMENEMMYGNRAITVRARLALTEGGGPQVEGMVKLMGGFSGFSPVGKNIKPSKKEYEIWECDIIIVPHRIHRNGPYKGHRLDQVLTDSRDIENSFKDHEDVVAYKKGKA